MNLLDPTDDQLTAMALEGAFLDVFGDWLPSPLPSRGSTRPAGGEEDEPDDEIRWATDDLMLDRCERAVPGDRRPYPERFSKGGG